MKELFTRIVFGALFVSILVCSAQYQFVLIALFFIFGILCLFEFNKLIEQRNIISYLIFSILFGTFAFWDIITNSVNGLNETTQILLTVTIFVLLFLIRDLFSSKSLPKLLTNRYINTTFYISAGIVFLLVIANNFGQYSPENIIGVFALIWINDSFAYIIGKNFGKQKLFESVSPKKTVEGFLGGMIFTAVGSYFISEATNILLFSNWLILGVIVSVFGTLGDLIESKYKRQAGVKDSGNLLPGHGGLLDRLDSAIFVAPFIYLFLRLLHYVS
ncbi:MAG: phosphatidate cytidylyltransferase [Bacteroidetes bacterium]|nr:phosphatidate cytidylyltransferase [Bacteroidota bacterium]MDA0860503.1 phosphatidate cytidylyltransferase [Bacteroidota bacterium]MDA1318715.1 phosphatidate cytidylyltransferase [Bacteroidota bacterium]